MLFDTPIFILFLTVVVAGYWCLKFRHQNRFLLVASYFFGSDAVHLTDIYWRDINSTSEFWTSPQAPGAGTASHEA